MLDLVLSLNSRNYVHDVARQHTLSVMSNILLALKDKTQFFTILRSVLTSHLEADSNLNSYTSNNILIQIESLESTNTISLPNESKIGVFLPLSSTIESLALISYSTSVFG